jgi:hypothetical protein
MCLELEELIGVGLAIFTLGLMVGQLSMRPIINIYKDILKERREG